MYIYIYIYTYIHIFVRINIYEWTGRGEADLDGEALEGVALWHRVANALRPRERKTGYEPPERVFASPPSANSFLRVLRFALSVGVGFVLVPCLLPSGTEVRMLCTSRERSYNPQRKLSGYNPPERDVRLTYYEPRLMVDQDDALRPPREGV